MKGYKALNQDMSSKYGNMTYELNKKYTISGELRMCENGYHFCKRLEDIEWYYNISTSRIFEVETDGKVIDDDDDNKSCAESITLLRELSKEEIKQYFIDNQERVLNGDYYGRLAMAEQRICLDKLINDKYWCVRIAVAAQGYGLDRLISDEDEDVRVAVAKQGYGLDRLINDTNCYVRVAVAKQGYGLDRLINDTNCYVRVAVAKQGYGLDKLIDDEDYSVYCAARRKLDELIFTKNSPN